MPEHHKRTTSTLSTEGCSSSHPSLTGGHALCQPTPAKSFRDPIQALSIANLAQHNAHMAQRRPDPNHVCMAIHAEQASRADEATIIRHYGPHVRRTVDPSIAFESSLAETSITKVENLYRSAVPSSMNSLQRYATLAPKLDPYLPNARKYMSDCGVNFADMSDAQLRFHAAVAIEQNARHMAAHTVVPELATQCRVQKAPRVKKRLRS